MQQVHSLSLVKIQRVTDLSQARSEGVRDGNNTGRLSQKRSGDVMVGSSSVRDLPNVILKERRINCMKINSQLVVGDAQEVKIPAAKGRLTSF